MTPQNNSPESWRFTNKHPINSGPTTSAGRQKKDWVSAGKSLAMGWLAAGLVEEIDPWVKQSALPMVIKIKQPNYATPKDMSTQPE
jgi:hypothetical protein